MSFHDEFSPWIQHCQQWHLLYTVCSWKPYPTKIGFTLLQSKIPVSVSVSSWGKRNRDTCLFWGGMRGVKVLFTNIIFQWQEMRAESISCWPKQEVVKSHSSFCWETLVALSLYWRTLEFIFVKPFRPTYSACTSLRDKQVTTKRWQNVAERSRRLETRQTRVWKLALTLCFSKNQCPQKKRKKWGGSGWGGGNATHNNYMRWEQ